MKNHSNVSEKKQAEIKDLEPFGKKMARLRRAAGYSQRSLAAEIGVSHRMVAYYEGETDRPPSHLLPTIAGALGISVDQLLGLTPLSPRKKPRNQQLLRTLMKVEKLPAQARKAVLNHIDALWSKERMIGNGN